MPTNKNNKAKRYLAWGCLVLIGVFLIQACSARITSREATKATAPEVIPIELPWQPLYELVDSELQEKLALALDSQPHWKKLIERKKLAVGVIDMSSTPPRFARVNGNVMMYAASLPKIAIMFAAYASFEDGSLMETPEIHADLVDMIRVSSNVSATRVLNLVGIEKVEQVLTDPKYGLYDEERGGGLWVGRAYASAGKRNGDPINNISHGATATQVCRFYYLLANGRLIDQHRSEQMLADLSDPQINHKFVNQLNRLAPDAKLFRKSGTWRNFHSDSVMVRGKKWRNYILVAMVESPTGGEIIKNILPTVEKVLQGK